MVRLAITDFASREDSEYFYINEEYDTPVQMFTYSAFKKYSAYLPKESQDKFYSLNLLSRKYLKKNQFLIHIADEDYVILFNHKTIYSAKINANFITDDMIKSILITKHITMLSSAGTIDNINYVINSRFRAGIESILKQNIKNEKGEIVARSLGDIEELVLPLKELDTPKSHTIKLGAIITMFLGSFWFTVFGLDIVKNEFLKIENLEPLREEIRFEENFITRQNKLLNDAKNDFNSIYECITEKEALK